MVHDLEDRAVDLINDYVVYAARTKSRGFSPRIFANELDVPLPAVIELLDQQVDLRRLILNLEVECPLCYCEVDLPLGVPIESMIGKPIKCPSGHRFTFGEQHIWVTYLPHPKEVERYQGETIGTVPDDPIELLKKNSMLWVL